MIEKSDNERYEVRPGGGKWDQLIAIVFQNERPVDQTVGVKGKEILLLQIEVLQKSI